LLNIEFLIEEGMIAKEDLNIFKVVDSAKEAWEYIINWHEENGTPLFGEGESKGF